MYISRTRKPTRKNKRSTETNANIYANISAPDVSRAAASDPGLGYTIGNGFTGQVSNANSQQKRNQYSNNPESTNKGCKVSNANSLHQTNKQATKA